MRKLFVLLCGIHLMNPTSQAATCTNLITDGLGNPLPTRVIITPFLVSAVFGGTNVLGPSMAINAPQGAWQAPLLGGFYYVQQGLNQPAIPIYSVPGDLQTNSLAYFANAATNPIPSYYSSGLAFVLTVSNFNANQFAFAANTISIKTGALVTNLVDYGNLQILGQNTNSATAYLYDQTGTNLLAGFDMTNYGGWFGPGITNGFTINNWNAINLTNVQSTNIVFFLNTWPGNTNNVTMMNTYQDWQATTPTSFSNLVGVLANQYMWQTINLSNSTGAAITQWCTIPAIRFIGSQSTNGLVVGAGKIGVWSFFTKGLQFTNCVNAAQQ